MKKTKRGPLRFLVIARTAPGRHPHPMEVAVHLAGAASRVSISVGPHAVNAGGQVPISAVLDESRTGLSPYWAEQFDEADLHWVVPYLVRLQAGEDVADEIVAAYTARHGEAPAKMFQDRYGV
ncbi:hypothetical protein DMC61_16075 [Amycolatopsis sp. WAC 04169]|uniref:hypothetical protein n=1 Tax=Amycolatopsis sp. WAC 04169 TaxID=2203197 RepID=UPI000F7995CA|nr:hypothetical protein [Amycolatopsis sp. WAC 04169]RSN31646.1 hypothetical protein DMC61_16075 [Amycolatopsis sp. WAC 04169]